MNMLHRSPTPRIGEPVDRVHWRLIADILIVDTFPDRVVLTFAESVVEGSNQAISCVGHCVDVHFSWCVSQGWDELVVMGDLADVVDDGCIELHVEVLLTRGKGGPVSHC